MEQGKDQRANTGQMGAKNEEKAAAERTEENMQETSTENMTDRDHAKETKEEAEDKNGPSDEELANLERDAEEDGELDEE